MDWEEDADDHFWPAIFISQFAMSGGWATQLALINNSTVTARGRIDIFDQSGNPRPVTLNGVTQSTFSYAIPAGGSIHPRSTGRKRSVAVLKSFHRYADGLLSGPIPRSVRRSGDQCVISLLRFKTRVPFVSECSGR